MFLFAAMRYVMIAITFITPSISGNLKVKRAQAVSGFELKAAVNV